MYGDEGEEEEEEEDYGFIAHAMASGGAQPPGFEGGAYAVDAAFGGGPEPELATPGVSLGLAGGAFPAWVPPSFFFS